MTTPDPRVCTSCGEPGERKDMAECDNGHFVHDACFPLDDGKCKKCHDPRVEEMVGEFARQFPRDSFSPINVSIAARDFLRQALTTYGDERYRDGLRRAVEVGPTPKRENSLCENLCNECIGASYFNDALAAKNAAIEKELS